MTASFFRNFERHDVEYPLISGQATVLYGAATFSEDIDLWINPTAGNLENFLAAMRESGARYYKLTPPLTPEHLARGHGFHFILAGEGESETFLDIMGVPPRTDSFGAASANARRMETEWGNIRTVDIKRLVEIKKTQRLEDYPVIGRLALAWFDQPECDASRPGLQWAVSNVFTLEELKRLLTRFPEAMEVPFDGPRDALRELGRQAADGGEAAEPMERKIITWMDARMQQYREADRRYWRPIIAELKLMHASGKLALEGDAV